MAFHDGNYVGDVDLGCRKGFGECRFTDGSVYIGTWADDYQNGEGKCWYPDGSTYTGLWKDGRWNGVGTWTTTRASAGMSLRELS